jgi:hypothetical protein
VQAPRVRRSQFERDWSYCEASRFCDAIEALARWCIQDVNNSRIASATNPTRPAAELRDFRMNLHSVYFPSDASTTAASAVSSRKVKLSRK